jgi:hypothetical protein
MPPSDATNLLGTLFDALEHAGHLEQELRRMADEVTAWRSVAEAAVRALDHQLGHSRESEEAGC